MSRLCNGDGSQSDEACYVGAVWHANLLHRSDSNLSDEPRWSFICCYNVASNTAGEGHRSYQPVLAWEPERVRAIGREQLSALERGDREEPRDAARL